MRQKTSHTETGISALWNTKAHPQFPTLSWKSSCLEIKRWTQHPGKHYYKEILWDILFCNNFCKYFKMKSTRDFSVMLQSLVCPCLQENIRRNLPCKWLLCKFYKSTCAKMWFFVLVLAMMAMYILQPITSFGGLFWGFKMTETEGEKKNHGGKGQRREEKKRAKTWRTPTF